jgi:hypothetical protein
VQPTPPTASPEREYEHRRLDRQRQADAAAWRERLVGNARVAVFVAALAVAYLGFFAHVVHPLWLLPLVVGFVVLLFVHESVTRAWFRAARAVAFYRLGQARLADDWKGKGQPGTRFLDDNHPYAADIDLFGVGSLFELLCTARTRTGEDTLAGWLKAGAPPAEIRARQEAVAELKPRLDLREELALLGSDLPAGVDFDAVVAWGASPPLLVATWPRWLALVLGVAAVGCLAGWLLALFGALDVERGVGAFFDYWRSTPLAILILLELALAGWLFRRVNAVLREVERRGRDLALLSSVLACLERATFAAPRLAALHRELAEGDGTGWMPSERIAQLGNLIDVLNSRRNQFFAPIALLLMWGTQLAHAIERWRARTGPSIGRWLAAVGEFEALCALAAYAYENPGDPFPDIVDHGPVYEGEGLAHPLLPRGKCVPNDLRLGGEQRVLLVSGSNMSGKSTFLRTVGINAVLALAGAPVRARRVRISPLAIGATLRIQDSLQAGRSRFYAEILRVRQVVDLSRGPVPLLFLLDEVFAGTNSHDRCVGAEAVVRGLVNAGAIGLVTTHDLTLTRIADGLGAKGSNVHFADHFEDGVMTFDYRLHQGVVRNSNALALMRAVGLEV